MGSWYPIPEETPMRSGRLNITLTKGHQKAVTSHLWVLLFVKHCSVPLLPGLCSLVTLYTCYVYFLDHKKSSTTGYCNKKQRRNVSFCRPIGWASAASEIPGIGFFSPNSTSQLRMFPHGWFPLCKADWSSVHGLDLIRGVILLSVGADSRNSIRWLHQ